LIFFNRLKYSQIPIWENKRRIITLALFRDLYLDTVMFPPGNRIPISPRTGQPFKLEERRSEINYRKPAIQEMVALAEIVARRRWPTRRKDLEPVDLDVLDQLWYLETFRVSGRAPIDVVEEAIGVYRDDQQRSWIRTFNPIFWLTRLINGLSDSTFEIVTIFGGDPHKARHSAFGRLVNSIERIGLWVAAVLTAILTVLSFLGFETPIRRLLHLG
jgi:hypothetical protein